MFNRSIRRIQLIEYGEVHDQDFNQEGLYTLQRTRMSITFNKEAFQDNEPEIDENAHFELKGQFLKELCDNTFNGLDYEDANEQMEKVLKIVDLFHIPDVTQYQIVCRVFPTPLTGAASRWLRNQPAEPDETPYQAWEQFKELLLRCPQHYLTDMQEVTLFYKGLDVHTRQILDFKGAIPSMKAADAKKAIQHMVDHSQYGTTEQAILGDCDIKATNIILQGLPLEVYALEMECKLYDEFDKFAYKKGETLREFYLRFSLLLNDMNFYNMKLEQFQVNTKFLNTLPPKWSKFVTDVKLVRDLHATNIDQLYAYLGQHEFHANEVRLMHERNSE
ncbi:hypothetical protein Tco_0914118 [Tanacetum coccineum]